MDPRRFEALTTRYRDLKILVLGDFCLDRYLEIDQGRSEISIETNLEVYNVTNVRSQPGGAGTILNNLVALGVGRIVPLGFCGDDGEGYELLRALRQLPQVDASAFLQTAERRTFTYCKPLIMPGTEAPASAGPLQAVESRLQPVKSHDHDQHPAAGPAQSRDTAPRELNRLDSKNWTPTPASVTAKLADALKSAAADADAIILLDQVDLPNTGVLTEALLATVGALATERPDLLIIGDSRSGLGRFPAITFKMNAAELALMLKREAVTSLEDAKTAAKELAARNGKPVFVTLAEQGIVAATPDGGVCRRPSLPVRGEIDIVGAGDSVTANLTTALAAGATPDEAIQLANAAASIVIHQLGTTGTASVEQIREALL